MRMLNRFFMAAGSLGLVVGSLTLPSAVPRAAAATGTNLIPAQTSDLEGAGTGLFVDATSANATNGTTYYLDSIGAFQGSGGSGSGGGNCTSPVWTDTAANTDNTDQYSGDSPYILAMDMWNATASPISQTMDVCNHASWYVDDTTTSASNTAVLVYPNVHEDYINWSTGISPPLSQFNTINSSYAANSTSAGDYEFAYDIWLNGFGAGHNEVMIWTQNHGQTPGGSLVASDITVSGLAWNLYASSDNSYIAFVPANGAAYSSGTLNLRAFFGYLMQAGHVASTSTLSQIDYGVEVCNTGGAEGQFNFTNFSVTTGQHRVPGRKG